MSKNKKYDDDDGRVIADMNVDGMPWNREYSRWFGGMIKPKYRKKIEAKMKEEGLNSPNTDEEELHMTKKETRVLVLNAIAAVLLIAGVFALAAFLFILFCLYVWFK